MVELAWGATNTKNTFLSRKFKDLVVRRGKKRSLVAIGSKMLSAAYFMMKNKEPYKEYRPTIHDKKKKEYIKNLHISKLETMGFTVQIVDKIA